jgi:hypothetical protein
LFTTDELDNTGRNFGLKVVESRDLGEEYRINELNYKNKMPDLNPDTGPTHQGWNGFEVAPTIDFRGQNKVQYVGFSEGWKYFTESIRYYSVVHR